MRYLLSYLFIAPVVFVSTAIMGSLSLASSLLGAHENRLHRIARAWGRILLRGSFIRTEVTGLEKLEPGRNYVFICNHASYMDTPVLIARLPAEIRFLAKSELFDIPLLGTHLSRAGHFSVHLENVRASLKSMTEAAKAIAKKNISLLIFPEGGRTLEHLEEFKEGAAYIAIKAGVPVVPMALIGTREILRMHSSLARPGLAKLIIGTPIETSGMTVQDRARLTAELHDRVAEMLGAAANSKVAC